MGRRVMVMQALAIDEKFVRFTKMLGIKNLDNITAIYIRIRAGDLVTIEVERFLEPNLDGSKEIKSYRLEEIEEEGDGSKDEERHS